MPTDQHVQSTYRHDDELWMKDPLCLETILIELRGQRQSPRHRRASVTGTSRVQHRSITTCTVITKKPPHPIIFVYTPTRLLTDKGKQHQHPLRLLKELFAPFLLVTVLAP